MKERKLDPEQLERLLSGEEPAAEPGLRMLREAVHAELRDTAGDWDVDAAWQRLQRSRRMRRWPGMRRVVLAAAAIAAVLVGGTSLYRMWQSQRSGWAEYVVGAEEVRTVELADGSRVWLAPHSRLRVPRSFGREDRVVTLAGEALFAVARAEAKPFEVHAGRTVTRVLGTVFTVAAFAGTDAVEVVVAEGRVQVRATDLAAARVLRGGQQARVSADGAITTHGVDAAAHIGWTEGRLAFENSTLGAALPRLSHWLDLEITLADTTLDTLRFSAVLDARAREGALDALAATLGVRYAQSGRTVSFHR